MEEKQCLASWTERTTLVARCGCKSRWSTRNARRATRILPENAAPWRSARRTCRRCATFPTCHVCHCASLHGTTMSRFSCDHVRRRPSHVSKVTTGVVAPTRMHPHPRATRTHVLVSTQADRRWILPHVIFLWWAVTRVTCVSRDPNDPDDLGFPTLVRPTPVGADQ